MHLILEDFKYGTGIRTAERTPKTSANNILAYFAKKKGTDWYKLSGGDGSYTIALFKKGTKKAEEATENSAKKTMKRITRTNKQTRREDNPAAVIYTVKFNRCTYRYPLSPRPFAAV